MADGAEIGKNAMGVVHIAGGFVLGMFGLGGVAGKLEEVETNAGLLPEWAQTKNRFGQSKPAEAPKPEEEAAKKLTPEEQQKLEKLNTAIEILREAGYSNKQIRKILEGPDHLWGKEK